MLSFDTTFVMLNSFSSDCSTVNLCVNETQHMLTPTFTPEISPHLGTFNKLPSSIPDLPDFLGDSGDIISPSTQPRTASLGTIDLDTLVWLKLITCRSGI